MQLDAPTCYGALRARDHRFDGHFFVAVKTTGIYCRPVCPARTPARASCVFFASAAEADRAGFRACFRCRPELSPGVASVDARPRLVRLALERIDDGCLDEETVDVLAAELGVSARHLRRVMEAEVGVSPVEYAQTRRLAVAKQLLQDTDLPLTTIAFAAGFGSVRRYNAVFFERFGRSPSEVRRPTARGRPAQAEPTLRLRLDYRPPLDWESLLDFLRARAIPLVEQVDALSYRRTVRVGDATGTVVVRRADVDSALEAELSLSLAPHAPRVVRRLRALFDLDADPTVIAEHLRSDRTLGPLVRAAPGVRVPSAFDPFEMAVRAIVGQQVSVRAATTIAGRIAASLGEERGAPGSPLSRIFPTAEVVSRASAGALGRAGLPRARAEAITALARAVTDRRVDFTRGDIDGATARLVELPGVGPWTAAYIAMRAMRWPDAFPAGDLVVRRALGVTSAREAEARAESLRPWRAYAVMHLWRAWGPGGGATRSTAAAKATTSARRSKER